MGGGLLACRIHDANLILFDFLVLLVARLTTAAHGGLFIEAVGAVNVVVVEETEVGGDLVSHG